MFTEHSRGQIAKNLVHNFFIEKGCQVLVEDTSQGLVDLAVINPENGKFVFVDVKCESQRTEGGANRRIYRTLKDSQKKLVEKTNIDIIIAYGNTSTKEVHISNQQKIF